MTPPSISTKICQKKTVRFVEKCESENFDVNY
jgi:hypothetical protein